MTILRTMACLLAAATVSTSLLTSCGDKTSKDTDAPKKETTRNPRTGTPMFIHVSAPRTLDDNAESIKYVLSHYWDKVTLSDSLWVHSYVDMDMAIVRFLTLANKNPDQKVSEQAIKDMMHLMQVEATPGVYNMMAGILDKYLDMPYSGIHNDNYYIIILNERLKSPNLTDAQKAIVREKLSTIMKNRQGYKAADFAYTTRDGHTSTLYDTDADYTLLMLYRPDNAQSKATCNMLAEILNESPLSGMTADGRLKVLAVCTGENMETWEKIRRDIPSEWIDAYDAEQAITSSQLYDLRYVPAIYLLDREKHVIAKNIVDLSSIRSMLTDK